MATEGLDRLERQLAFLIEIDKLKDVVRRNYLAHGERRENTAEHSWHLAMAALVLAEHAAQPVDLGRVVPMLLVHDLVEIDAGDTFCYDPVAHLDKEERERRAADRLFALLPGEQGAALRELWEEFEARATPEACFANAIDRLMPVLHNYHSQGRGWRENGVDAGQVLARNRPIGEGSAALWKKVQAAIDDAVARGLLAPAKS
jgi:5'-deoxynucleotidase YfbR-like HD superfamily hydrolase